MKNPVARKVVFHGIFTERYAPSVVVGADSMFTLCSIIFKEIFPDLLNEKFTLALEDDNGVQTDLFDTEQVLLPNQKIIHIIPNPDGAVWWWIPYLVMAIMSVGVALLMAPKTDVNATDTASGANWETAENVVGQGGVVPVLLGTRMVGSRVVSHGIDSVLYVSKQIRPNTAP
jgi:hypothetical protein